MPSRAVPSRAVPSRASAGGSTWLTNTQTFVQWRYTVLLNADVVTCCYIIFKQHCYTVSGSQRFLMNATL